MIAWFKRYFLSEKQIFYVIILNSLVIFFQEFYPLNKTLQVIDLFCTLVFTMEMVVKIQDNGLKGYLKDRWNIMDGFLVILSFPSVVALFISNDVIMHSYTFLKVLRSLRVFRFARVIHIFPDFDKIIKSFGVALKRSYAVLIGMCIFVLIFSIISFELFHNLEQSYLEKNDQFAGGKCENCYFQSPLDSTYTIFRLFTGEGWNEIPDAVARYLDSNFAVYIVRVYFSVLLVLGCFVVMSMLNSIFVDAMISDDRLDVQKELRLTQEKLANIEEKLNKLLADNGKDPTNKN